MILEWTNTVAIIWLLCTISSLSPFHSSDKSVAFNTPNFTNYSCKQIPTDPFVTRRPGDGEYELRVQLMPPGSTRIRGSGNRGIFWPLSNTEVITETGSKAKVSEKSPTEYLPGREYAITVAPKQSPTQSNTFLIEAVYLTAVPLDTTESQEYFLGQGNFSPTVCDPPSIGVVEYRHNFPRKVTFLWTAPKDSSGISEYGVRSNEWNLSRCLEIRATVVPWHWHRIYFRNTGSLKHTMCPARDLRRIEGWPNYVSDRPNKSPSGKQKESIKARSISTEVGTNHQEVRDRYSESGFYGADETVACSLQEIPKPVRRCCACNTAIYRLVIQSDWQQQQHWKDWPAGVSTDGPGTSPHFSEILGVSHSPEYDVFHDGGYASPAVDAVCTASDVSKLENEFRNQAAENILTVIRMRGVNSHAPPEQRIRSALFAVNGTHHLISFLTRLVPSPDWCTGLSRVDVCLPNCSWPLHLQFRLEPWDAGVIAGDTYIPLEHSERLREPKPMCPITPDLRPNTPFTVLTDYVPVTGHSSSLDGSVRAFNTMNMDQPKIGSTIKDNFMESKLSPNIEEQIRLLHSTPNGRIRRRFARLGTAYLELLRINENEACSPEPLQEDQGISRGFPNVLDEGALGKCKLSSWSEWRPCSTVDISSCPTAEAKAYWSKRPPQTQRTRFILPPANPLDCEGVPLKEEKMCNVPVVKQRCDEIPDYSGRNGKRLPLNTCLSVPWGPWSECMNVSCGRPGMIYRWREFPDMEFKRACEGYPLVSQVDTCWPPPKEKCDSAELKKACFEEPPTSLRLCVRPQNGTTRYYFHPSEHQCKPFDYVAGCHLRALMSGHVIGLTRNMFLDKDRCNEVCNTADISKSDTDTRASRIYKRSQNFCDLPMDQGTECYEQMPRQMWYFDGISHSCLPFAFAGCGGNLNAFPSLEDCKQACE